MIDVEQRKTIRAPAATVKAVLADLEHLQRLLPRAERVEVQARTENRARLAITLRAGRLVQRIEGEARILENGLRFVAVQPAEVDARWTVEERGGACEVTARLAIDPGQMLGPLGRFLPQRMIVERIGQELEASLRALEGLVRG